MVKNGGCVKVLVRVCEYKHAPGGNVGVVDDAIGIAGQLQVRD